LDLRKEVVRGAEKGSLEILLAARGALQIPPLRFAPVGMTN
jgi:hypothetical protein